MAQISLVINDELDTKFRKVVATTLGLKKGNIKIAIEEAIQLWIDHHKV
ncbi:Uncharacterised protein [uncultured archaeon]|nr:Uncharacterised protein [uncultured archaeon]